VEFGQGSGRPLIDVDRLLGCVAMLFRRSVPTFQRNCCLHPHSRGGRCRYMVQKMGTGATSQPVACQYS